MNKNNELIRTLLLEEFCNFFKYHPTEQIWKGTVWQIARLLQSNPLNDGVLKWIDNPSILGVLTQLASEGASELSDGVWSVSRSALTATLVFEPVSTDSSKRVLSCWFEGDVSRPGYIAPESQMERLQRLQDGSPEYKSLFKQLLPPEQRKLKK